MGLFPVPFRAAPARVLLLAALTLLMGPKARAQGGHHLETRKEAAILGTGLLFHGIGLWQQHAAREHPTTILDLAQVPGFDRIATRQWHPAADRASNVLFGAAAAASLATAIIGQHGNKPLVPAVILVESGLLSSGLTNTVKEWARRPRPYRYNPAVPETAYRAGDDDLSFWSGHTANSAAITFACASLVQHSDASRGMKTATWIGAAAIPAAMGCLRVQAGKHFPTDVLAGYAVGAAVGLLVPWLHRHANTD